MNKNLPISSIDLAQDADFILWVKGGCGAGESYWYHLLTTGHEELNEAVQIVRSGLGEDLTYETHREDALLARINDSLNEVPTAPVKPKLRLLYWTSAAAAACLLFLFFIKPPHLEILETDNAEQIALILPEGSAVTINADSDLQYHKKHFAQSRKIELDGEAFFEVSKGDAFIVETAYGNVEVLGTSFNVYAREDRFEVSCHTGKVKVTNKDNNSFVILTPGQESVLSSGKIEKIDRQFVEKEWLDGIFHFEDADLADVMAEMERQFDIKIKLSADTESKKYTGYFENNNLEEAFNSVLWPLRLQLIEKSEDEFEIVLSKE